MAHLWNVRISLHRCAFLFIYIESRHGFGNEFYLWYEYDVLLHDGFPVLEKRKGDALSDDYVAHDCGRPAVGKGHGFLSDLWF